MIVSLAEAKKYLRVDYTDEDTLIRKFIRTGSELVKDTLRISEEDFEVTATVRVAVLFAVAYFFEHREDADMDELTRSLRYMLSTEREAAF